MLSQTCSRCIGLLFSYLTKLSEGPFGAIKWRVSSYKLLFWVHICFEIYPEKPRIHPLLYFHCPLFFFWKLHLFLIFLSVSLCHLFFNFLRCSWLYLVIFHFLFCWSGSVWVSLWLQTQNTVLTQRPVSDLRCSAVSLYMHDLLALCDGAAVIGW